MGYFEEFATEFVQSIGSKDGAVSPAVIGSASFGYGDSKSAEKIFAGSLAKPLYARVGNPTNAKLEMLLANMDGGEVAVATSSGMAAITVAVMSLLSSGDEVISIGGLFGGTYSFFSESAARFGIRTKFFDVDDLEAIELAVSEKTKLIFLESVGNPNLRLPDIASIAQIANFHGIAFAVDNTTTPMSVQPLKLGADIVIYSTTKIISGNASALGGAVIYRDVDTKGDKFISKRYEELAPFIEKMGKRAFMGIARKRAMRDFGMSANAHTSYLTMLGLETLPLRMDRVVKSVERVAKGLYENGVAVRHPSLLEHEHHARYEHHFPKGCGPLLTIDFENRERAFSFLDNSKLITITANIGDSRTLGLHMASTIYGDFDDEALQFLGISEGLVRISIGIENPEDILSDFLEAINL